MELVSTATVPSSSRFRFWQDTICAYYPSVEISAERGADFTGTINTQMLGAMRVTSVHSGAQRVLRSPRHISDARDDILQLNFQLAGEGFLSQDGRDCITPPGSFVLYDSTRPYELRFKAPFKQTSIKLPRKAFRERYGSLDAFTARTIDGTHGPGRFLYAFVQEMARQQDDPADALISERLHDHFGDLLLTALSPLQQDGTHAASRSRSGTLLRAKTHILSHLHDPELSPDAIATALGMSLRSLHTLFEREQTTLWRWIQSARLSRCKADLEDPACLGRSIGDVAYSRGFADAAHFSRIFRKAYGLSPRECRNAAR